MIVDELLNAFDGVSLTSSTKGAKHDLIQPLTNENMGLFSATFKIMTTKIAPAHVGEGRKKPTHVHGNKEHLQVDDSMKQKQKPEKCSGFLRHLSLGQSNVSPESRPNQPPTKYQQPQWHEYITKNTSH